MRTRVDLRARQALWSAGFLTALFAPLMLSLGAGSDGDLMIELSLTTGILAASTLTCTVVAASRMRSLTHAFGIELLVRSHRWLAVVTLVVVLAHVGFVIADNPADLVLLVPWTAPARARAATLATVCVVLLCLLSIHRERLRTRYERWRLVHIVLGVGAVTGSALHIVFLDHLTRDALMRTWFAVSLGLLVTVMGYRWLLRPLLSTRHAFVVDHLRRESDSVCTLVLRPLRNRHRGLTFDPGQFVWMRLDRPLATAEEHPFTIASGAHRPREIEITIRTVGDFTELVTQLRPGRRVYLDGPHGSFTVDARKARGLVLLAGGVGITPMMSMLRTLAHRRDERPLFLVLSARTADDLLFREELRMLTRRLRLTVVEVLSKPPPGWKGAVGHVDDKVLDAVLPVDVGEGRYDVYVCGPAPMVGAAIDALQTIGVPSRNVRTEMFDMA